MKHHIAHFYKVQREARVGSIKNLISQGRRKIAILMGFLKNCSKFMKFSIFMKI